MKPGRKPTPHPELDLEEIWRILDEEPPGPIVTLTDPAGATKPEQRPSR